MEIQYPDTSGIATEYVNLTNPAGEWYNTVGAAFETFNASNFTQYAISATEFGTSGVYHAAMPLVAAGIYNIVARRQSGGSPAQSDLKVAAGEIDWNGTIIIRYSNVEQIEATAPDDYISAAVWDEADGVELTITQRQAMRAIASALAGDVVTAGSIYKALANAGTTRLTVSDDGSGNRTVTTSL